MKPKNTIKKNQRTAKTKAKKRIDKHVDDEEDDIFDIDDGEEGEEGEGYLDDMDLERGAAPDAEGGGGAGGRDSGLAAMVEGSEPSDGLSSDEAGSAASSRIESGTELISHRVL